MAPSHLVKPRMAQGSYLSSLSSGLRSVDHRVVDFRLKSYLRASKYGYPWWLRDLTYGHSCRGRGFKLRLPPLDFFLINVRFDICHELYGEGKHLVETCPSLRYSIKCVKFPIHAGTSEHACAQQWDVQAGTTNENVFSFVLPSPLPSSSQ